MNERISIYYFSSIPYSFLRQRPQQLFNAFRKGLQDVDYFYVEPPHGLRSIEKKTPDTAPDGVISSPLVMPFEKLGLGCCNSINRRLVRHAMASDPNRKKVAIVCTTAWEAFLPYNYFDLVCYDCLDALQVHAGSTPIEVVQKAHERLLQNCGLVFVTADRLREELASPGVRYSLATVSNGVDIDFFSEKAGCDVKLDVHGQNVIGYVGALRNWIDLNLIAQAAQARPWDDFILIGPADDACRSAIALMPDNVQWLGEKPYHEVPGYIEKFDVALIPFRNNPIAEATDPIKMYEYFCLGKPVVATNMRQLLPYNDDKLLSVTDTADSFIRSIEHFALHDTLSWQQQRREIARANTWTSKASFMLEEIYTHLPLSKRSHPE